MLSILAELDLFRHRHRSDEGDLFRQQTAQIQQARKIKHLCFRLFSPLKQSTPQGLAVIMPQYFSLAIQPIG
ncbi:hypothetical protein BTE48_07515 [Oceanospirillum multiglobuliferum]|uniref:Uncharacterized protein n=1 Tax=Oceanospirillum multiglobuliferum TaxID=64969 RepID=A0A1V4T548_9GAMM|nr:hypothetical protein BTE48_07515 [Oceanospirillum multiglobuliferum]